MSRDYSAPALRVTVEDTVLLGDITQLIESVEWDESTEEAGMGSISVANPDARFNDELVFQPGNEVEIELGYGDELEHVGRFFIVRHLPNFPASGMPTLTIRGYSKEHEMSWGGRRGKVWRNTTHADILRALATQYGFDVTDVEDSGSARRDFIQRRGKNDQEFARDIADLAGYEMVVDHDGLHRWRMRAFKPRKNETARYEFAWGADGAGTLLEFRPEFSVADASTELEVSYFDANAKEWKRVTVEENEPDESMRYRGDKKMSRAISSSTALRLSASGPLAEIVPDRPFRNGQEAVEFARKYFAERKDQFVTGRGRVVGLPNLRPRDIVKLSGLGVRLGGDYRLTNVSHRFDSGGYTTEFIGRMVLK